MTTAVERYWHGQGLTVGFFWVIRRLIWRGDMKRVNKLKSIAVLAVLLAGFTSSASAGSITISRNNGYRAGLGGEFNVSAANADGAALLSNVVGFTAAGTTLGTAAGTLMAPAGSLFGVGFETFCIEYNEHITLPGTYEASIGAGAMAGGVGGAVGGIDLISVGTAYLYSRFATGALASDGYTYAPGAARAASAVQLQEAIWYLEDEIALPSSNSFLTLVFSVFGTPAGAKANQAISSSGVRALNLGPNQDQLVMVPDGGLTVTLLGIGLGGLALLRRKSA